MLKKIPVARQNMFKKMFISSIYKILLNSDTWRNHVLHEFNISSQILDDNIRETDYLDIQKKIY